MNLHVAALIDHFCALMGVLSVELSPLPSIFCPPSLDATMHALTLGGYQRYKEFRKNAASTFSQ
jgi:hypothetical protein